MTFVSHIISAQTRRGKPKFARPNSVTGASTERPNRDTGAIVVAAQGCYGSQIRHSHRESGSQKWNGPGSEREPGEIRSHEGTGSHTRSGPERRPPANAATASPMCYGSQTAHGPFAKRPTQYTYASMATAQQRHSSHVENGPSPPRKPCRMRPRRGAEASGITAQRRTGSQPDHGPQCSVNQQVCGPYPPTAGT
jgi:hypothetical protein